MTRTPPKLAHAPSASSPASSIAGFGALDAANGRHCAGFGENDQVDLCDGLRKCPARIQRSCADLAAGCRGVIVAGSAAADNGIVDAASGGVRGIDPRTGKVLWCWAPVPQDPADPAYATWQGHGAHRSGGANAWSVIAADPERHLVGMRSASPAVDYWGSSRLGANRRANSVVALNLRTGKLRWAAQSLHHDLWDYDKAAPPALIEVAIVGIFHAVVVQATKTGQLFELDRDNREPLFPVEERPVLASDAAGESAFPTQPFGTMPLSPPRPDLSGARTRHRRFRIAPGVPQRARVFAQ